MIDEDIVGSLLDYLLTDRPEDFAKRIAKAGRSNARASRELKHRAAGHHAGPLGLPENGEYWGNARIAVEIEVAAILARSKDRVGERGGSRREEEWQEPRSRAKRTEPS